MKTNLGAYALIVGLGTYGYTTAHATGFTLGDAGNYAIIFQGGGGNTLNLNNGPMAGGLAVSGNVGIAGTGQLGLSGPLIVNGNIDFAGSVTPSGYASSGPYVNGNITVNGSISGGHGNVQSDMNYLNSLSTTLGGELGTSIALNSGTTINAASGHLDGSGNVVFSASSISLPNGTLTVQGDGIHNVVINVSAAADANFHPNNILLLGGLLPNQVLWNFYGGDASGLTGGPNLDINSNGGTLAGVFLDPYGDISVVHTLLDGYVYGGDSHNEQVVSGAYVQAPTNSLPDGGSTALYLGLACGALFAVKKGLPRVRRARAPKA